MSVRVSGGVYVVPPSGNPLSPSTGPPTQTKPPAVAIVTPQRSNSLDFLNFEEKRQLIASSLSLTDFLHHSGSATSPSSPTSGNVFPGKKQNGAATRSNSVGPDRTPSIERKGKLSALGKLFKPWKWKRKKKSEKFEAASRSLERKISVRVPRDELVQKGILIESPTSIGNDFKPDKTEMQSVQQTNGACLSPIGEPPPAPSLVPPSVAVDNCRPERPSSLGPGKLTRRLLCYHNDNTASRIMPDTAFCEGDKVCTPPVQMNSPLMLSELPEPPIPVSEIGPIPPPPMFSSPPPSTATVILPSSYTTTTQPVISTNIVTSSTSDVPSLSYEDCGGAGEDIPHCEDISFEEDEYEEDDVDASELMRLAKPDPTIDTSKIEEIPAKEPKFHAVPLKSALKKPATPTQEIPSSAQISNRPVRFGLTLPCTLENKENTRPFSDLDNENDTSDGPVLYRSDDSESRIAAKIARKDSLALKLALRPDRQELIDRNILQLQTEKERQENKEAVGARLIRRLSMRPTQEELEDRNILKKQSAAEEKKLKEEKKRMLLRKLSFRPTVEELKEKKIIRFNDYIEVTQAHDYDRRADKPWTRLTPKDKAAIRKELNEFKSSEMEVHQDSRHLTRFHRP